MLPCGFRAQPTKPPWGALSTLSCPQSSSGTITHCCWSPASISYRHDPLKTLTIRDVSPSIGVSVGEVWDRRHLAVLPNNILYVRPVLSLVCPLSCQPGCLTGAVLGSFHWRGHHHPQPLLLDNRAVWRSRISIWFRYVNGPSGWSNWTQRTSDPQLGRTFWKLPF